MRIKTILVIGFLFGLFHADNLQAQTVEYSYDQAGNRTSRQIVNLGSGSSQAKRNTETADSIVVKDILGKLEVKIFPNPTKGALGVELTGINPEITTRISVYGGQGAQLYNVVATEGFNPLDFSKYPEGWYILRIEAGTERKEYKIIKQ